MIEIALDDAFNGLDVLNCGLNCILEYETTNH